MIQIVLLRPHLDPARKEAMFHMHPKGFPNGLSVQSTEALFANLGAILEKLRAADPDNLVNVFYTVGHHTGVGGTTPVRTKLSYDYQTIVAFDIDHVDQNRAWEYLPIVATILKVTPQSLVFTSTGGGVHVIAHLKKPIRSNKYLEETKPNYSELIYKINAALREAGLPGKGDPAIYDAPRILRLPNTINEKKGARTEARLLQCNEYTPVDVDIVKLSGLDRVSLENISPAQLKKNYPRPDFNEFAHQCAFMKWALTSPTEVHEPHFMSIVGLLGAVSPGDKATIEGRELTAQETAERIFDAASASKSLSQCDFGTKWEHGLRYGAPKCATISANWIGGCETCPHHHKINTPLALKAPDHISSEANGYWVLGSKGTPLNPHYNDLEKIYRREFSYVTCEPDRIFTFGQTHYRQTGGLSVKSWLDKKVGHSECLRDMHCSEFVKKILRSSALSEQQEADLFEQSIRGKINCRNGMMNVVTSELEQHTPHTGFKYVLPYDFEQGQVSEFFIDWLAEMMQNRTELIDAVLDLMAYCLWPTYDDHVFGYLVGEGRNGKSTLLHIIQELVGKANYSTVSLGQLGSNRFAPANLEGKLVNVSEESSGTDLTSEELNIIKDLSAGGEIQVERKGQQPFTLHNQAKMVFSANKPPRFHETGRAIRSRLLVVPFDHTITSPDPNVEKKLIAEVPKIFSMLVARIQENIQANGGKFKVSRGGHTVAQAQDRILLAGNSIVEWGKDCLHVDVSLGEDKYIVVRDSYERYKTWCAENGYKPSNIVQFGQTMTKAVLKGVEESKLKKIAGKVVRIYPYVQWKDER